MQYDASDKSKMTVKLFSKLQILISSFLYPPAAPLLVCINLLRLQNKSIAILGFITIPFVSFLLVILLRRQETGSQAVEFLSHMTFYVVNCTVAAVLHNKYVESDEVYIHAPEKYLKAIEFGLLALFMFIVQVGLYKVIGRAHVAKMYLQADALTEGSNHNASIAAFQKSYERAMLFDEGEIAAVSLDRIGNYQLRSGNSDEALITLTKALDIAVRSKSDRALMVIYGDMGNYYLSRINYSVAIKYKILSLGLRGDKEFQEGFAPALTEVAVLYMKIREYSHAIEYFERALKRYIELGDKQQQASVSLLLGDAYRRFGNGELTNVYLLRSKNVFLELGDSKRAEYVQGIIDGSNALSY